MANGMAGTSPSTGGPMRAGPNINPQTGQRYRNTIADLQTMQRSGQQLNQMQLDRLQNAPEYKNTLGDLRAMQRSGQELSPFQMNRLENAPGQGNLERVSPGVYRNQQGQLVNPQGQQMPQQPQQPQMPMQTLPYGMPTGMGQGVAQGLGNWLGTNPQGLQQNSNNQMIRPAVMPTFPGMNGMFPYNK